MYAAAPIMAALSVQYNFCGTCIFTFILLHISSNDSLIYELLATPPLTNNVSAMAARPTTPRSASSATKLPSTSTKKKTQTRIAATSSRPNKEIHP